MIVSEFSPPCRCIQYEIESDFACIFCDMMNDDEEHEDDEYE
jgi:hypothetical protein